MKSQLYLTERMKEFLKSQISNFVGIYTEKLLPVFKNIENDADKREKDLFNDAMSQPAYGDSFDPASIAETARDEAIDYYSYLKLGKYNLTATWHATLYQLWEQQSRHFLWREMSHVKKIQPERFCTNLSEIKEKFKLHYVDIESFSCWAQIEELYLLCNVIKHGEGNSAEKLRKINLALFKQEGGIDYIKTFKTTLLEETLNIDEMTLQNYGKVLLSFWDKIPERNYSDEL